MNYFCAAILGAQERGCTLPTQDDLELMRGSHIEDLRAAVARVFKHYIAADTITTREAMEICQPHYERIKMLTRSEFVEQYPRAARLYHQTVLDDETA